MRRKESKKGKTKPCRRWSTVRRAFFPMLAAMIVMSIGSGCTRKEELTFSIQETQPGENTAEEGTALGQQVQDGSSEEEETAAGAAENVGTETAGRDEAKAADDAEADAWSDGHGQICVHVCGAVMDPGVYELPAGSRVFEAVQAAGGFREDADESYVNQAQQLPDGVQLIIPMQEQTAALEKAEGQPDGQADAGAETGESLGTALRIGIISQDTQDSQQYADAAGSSGTESADDGKININTASESQLCDIPGIGAVRAAAIAAYRQEHGAFETIEDIMKVSGIKQGTYDKIKDSIKVK